MANKSSFFPKLLIAALLAAAAVWAGMYLLRPVARVVTVASGKAIKAVPGSVVVSEEKSVEIKSEVSGRITESEIDPGQVVKAGDLLIQIDTGDVDLEIKKITSDLATLKAQLEVGSAIALQLETSKDSLTFAENQMKRGSLAQAELDRRRRETKALEQQRELEKISDKQKVEQLENLLKTRERQREKMTLRAPFDGQVTAVYAHKGALIGSEKIGTLITLTRTVEAKISEENFGGIKVGKHADVTFLGGIGGKASDWVFTAKVKKILPTADPETQRYIVHLDVEVEPEFLTPGKTGEVTITVDEREAKAIIPRRALVGSYVYVVKNEQVEIRRVKSAYTWLTGVEITEGLQPGDEVILENQDTFREGQRVRVVRIAPNQVGAPR